MRNQPYYKETNTERTNRKTIKTKPSELVLNQRKRAYTLSGSLGLINQAVVLRKQNFKKFIKKASLTSCCRIDLLFITAIGKQHE